VWGYDFIGEEKTVNIHIMNLRKKLDTDLIETIRGVGYRLGKEN
jgi:two-component system response regulator VanR